MATTFTLFPQFDESNLNTKFTQRAADARNAEKKLLEEYSKLGGDAKAAARDLYRDARTKHNAWQALGESATDLEKETAATKAREAKEALFSFGRGEKTHKVGENAVQLGNEAGKEVRDAFVTAEQASRRVVAPQASPFGIVRTQKDGFSKALKQNGEKMKFWSKDLEGFAPRGKAFAHGSLVVGSAVALGDAVLRSKNSEGEDRSGTSRVLEAVAAGMVGSAALLHGAALAR